MVRFDLSFVAGIDPTPLEDVSLQRIDPVSASNEHLLVPLDVPPDPTDRVALIILSLTSRKNPHL